MRAGVYAGARKVDLAARAAADGWPLVLVDDGFSHWALERDLDLVLLDARDLWGGGALLPAGRLREPRRALQRAEIVIVSRLDPGEDPEPVLAQARDAAPAALVGAARHRFARLRPLDPGAESSAPPRRVHVVTATGAPRAVERTAREAGLEVASLAVYRDHHWFRPDEVRREGERARSAGAALMLTAKDAVRWPREAAAGVWVAEVEWEWVREGEAIEAWVAGRS
jgi:tetraacyldisaccharide 4'-kinase